MATNEDKTKQTVPPENSVREEIDQGNLTLNPGDRVVDESASVEEKSEQIAVDAPDITGDQITIPAYFTEKDADGEEKALHHVKDAEEISDVIRQMRMDDEGNRTWR